MAPAIELDLEGTVYPVQDTATLQRWVAERRVLRGDRVRIDGGEWQAVGERAELEIFFALVERSDQKGPLAGGKAPTTRAEPPPPTAADAGWDDAPAESSGAESADWPAETESWGDADPSGGVEAAGLSVPTDLAESVSATSDGWAEGGWPDDDETEEAAKDASWPDDSSAPASGGGDWPEDGGAGQDQWPDDVPSTPGAAASQSAGGAAESWPEDGGDPTSAWPEDGAASPGSAWPSDAGEPSDAWPDDGGDANWGDATEEVSRSKSKSAAKGGASATRADNESWDESAPWDDDGVLAIGEKDVDDDEDDHEWRSSGGRATWQKALLIAAVLGAVGAGAWKLWGQPPAAVPDSVGIEADGGAAPEAAVVADVAPPPGPPPEARLPPEQQLPPPAETAVPTESTPTASTPSPADVAKSLEPPPKIRTPKVSRSATAGALVDQAWGILDQGDDYKAEDYFGKALDIMPEHGGARFGLGYIAERRGDIDRAHREYCLAAMYGRKDVDLSREVGGRLRTLGRVCTR